VVALRPFTVRRTVRWADCDPAGVVYSGNFAEYILSAVHLFRRHVFGQSWSQMREDSHVDTPAKALSLVFEGSLWPDDVVDIRLYVGAIRTRTADFIARAERADSGASVFDGRVAFICVSAENRRVAAAIPSDLRDALDRYRGECPPPFDLLERVW
jgi:acyl-CoA thioesterase FadM